MYNLDQGLIMGERPLQCSGCKKEIKTIYKDIASGAITTCEMCADCPALKEKLHGGEVQSVAEETHLVCHGCETRLDGVSASTSLGCSECYAVFEKVLEDELLASTDVPERLKSKDTTSPLHIGKSPDTPPDVNLSEKLQKLNNDLGDALEQENYEEAAYLRDQIKELVEEKHDE